MLGLGLMPRMVRASGGWTPASLGTTLKLWLRSDLGITLATGVSAWADQSGNGNNVSQSVTANQPLYNPTGGPNGKPSITCDGVSRLLLSNSTGVVARGNDRTAVCLVQDAAPAIGKDVISFYQALNWTIRYGGTAGSASTTSDEASYNTIGTYTPDTNAHSVASTFHNGAVSPYYIDNVSITQSAPAITSPESGPVSFYVGAGDNGAIVFNGQVNEVIVCDTVLSAPQLALIHSYQMSFWGIS